MKGKDRSAVFKRDRRGPGCRWGLTLIELLCVLAIISLLLLVGILPGINRGGKRRLETAAWQLVSEMRLAQQAALATGLTTRIEFRRGNNDYKVSYPEEKYTIRLPEGIGYCYINFPEVASLPLLEFKGTGAPNRGGTVGFKNGDNEKIYIIVTPATGRIRVSDRAPAA